MRVLATRTPVLLVLIEAHSFAFLFLLDIFQSPLSNRLPPVILLRLSDRVSMIILSLRLRHHRQLPVPLKAGRWPLQHQHLSRLWPWPTHVLPGERTGKGIIGVDLVKLLLDPVHLHLERLGRVEVFAFDCLALGKLHLHQIICHQLYLVYNHFYILSRVVIFLLHSVVLMLV